MLRKGRGRLRTEGTYIDSQLLIKTPLFYGCGREELGFRPLSRSFYHGFSGLNMIDE